MKKLVITAAFIIGAGSGGISSAQTTIAGAGSTSQSGAAAQAQAGSVGYALGVGGSSGSSANNSISFDNHSVGSDLSDQVPTMFIPNLTTSNGTCANSFSMGGSGAGFGVAFGKTYVSGPCNARFNANQLNSLGMDKLAMETMCGIKSVYEADQRLKAQGRIPRCVSREEAETDPVSTVDPTGEPAVVWFDELEMDEVDTIAMLDAEASEKQTWGYEYSELQTNQ